MRRLAAVRPGLRAAAIVLASSLLYGCPPMTLRTVVLTPTNEQTGTSGPAGAIGYCTGPGSVPSPAFSPRANQVLVGYDDYYRPGAQPLPCDHLRDSNFRADVMFDLSAFDQVAVATLSFDTVNSASRSNGETTSTNPPTSYATTLGVGTQPPSADFPDTNEASLPGGPTISVAVGSQVSDWVTKKQANFGFVIWGPRGPVDSRNPPKDNNAQVSFYQNFRLTIVYNPVLNPRAPQ